MKMNANPSRPSLKSESDHSSLRMGRTPRRTLTSIWSTRLTSERMTSGAAPAVRLPSALTTETLPVFGRHPLLPQTYRMRRVEHLLVVVEVLLAACPPLHLESVERF